MNNSKAKQTPEGGYNKSCDSCRHHKVRCILESSRACQRCERLGKPCVFTAPLKRKQRKRTDTRVAELEREVEAMRALFDHKSKQSKLETLPENGMEMQYSVEAIHDPSVSGQPSEMAGSSPLSPIEPATNWNPYIFSPDSDVIERGIISTHQAALLLQIYNEDVVHNYLPVAVFSPQTTVEDLRRNKPTLFLAAIAAAAGKVSPTLFSILNSESIAAYTYRTVVKSEKSMELVQAMMISSIWYKPPGTFARLKFYEYIHMAISMAIDLGYGTNPRGSRNRGVSAPMPLSDQDVEQRRIFLHCFVISLTVAVALRRPNMLRFNAWLDTCLETVADLPNPTSHDIAIVAWVRLSKITEEIHTSLSLDDMGSVLNLSDSRTQMIVNGFETALNSWSKSVEFVNNKSLFLAYHHSHLYLHEVSLHDDHPPEHFRPPFIPDQIFTLTMDPTAKSSHIKSTSACICHAQSLLEIIMSMSVDELRAMPVYTFGRMLYAVNMLTKLHISSKSPSSKVGAHIDTNSIRLGYYLEVLINKLVEAVGPVECRSPLVFLGLLQWIRIWYKSQINDEFFSPPTNLPGRPAACMMSPISEKALSEDKFMNGQMNTESDPSPPATGNSRSDSSPNEKLRISEVEGEFEPFELLAFDPDFNNWNSDLNILPPVDMDFIPPNLEWGFPGMTNNTH